MSLAEAVLAVADAMDKHATDDPHGHTIGTACLRSYARELRTAVKAAGPQIPVQQVNPMQRIVLGDLERHEIRRTQEGQLKAKFEEQQAQMACCEGGPADGVNAPVAGMPEGAFACVEGAVYQFSGGKLKFHAGQTARLLKEGNHPQAGLT